MQDETSSTRTVLLQAGAGDSREDYFLAPVEAVKKQSILIRTMMEDDDDADTGITDLSTVSLEELKARELIPLPELSADILKLVIQFMIKHRDDPLKKIEKPIKTTSLKEIVGEWDAEFVNLEQEPLFKLILAANYLDMPDLLELGICKLATMVKGKDPEEIKRLFNIEPDITPEEEKMVRDSNPWIFNVENVTPVWLWWHYKQ